MKNSGLPKYCRSVYNNHYCHEVYFVAAPAFSLVFQSMPPMTVRMHSFRDPHRSDAWVEPLQEGPPPPSPVSKETKPAPVTQHIVLQWVQLRTMIPPSPFSQDQCFAHKRTTIGPNCYFYLGPKCQFTPGFFLFVKTFSIVFLFHFRFGMQRSIPLSHCPPSDQMPVDQRTMASQGCASTHHFFSLCTYSALLQCYCTGGEHYMCCQRKTNTSAPKCTSHFISYE